MLYLLGRHRDIAWDPNSPSHRRSWRRRLEGLTLKGTGWVGGPSASPVGVLGPLVVILPSPGPAQPTVHRIPVELISPGPESGGNCLFLAYDSPRMRVGPCTAEGGGDGRKQNLRAWRAKEDTAQPKPSAQPCDSLRQGQAQVLCLVGPPQLRPGWPPVPMFPFSLSLKALETMGFPFFFLATAVLLVLCASRTHPKWAGNRLHTPSSCLWRGVPGPSPRASLAPKEALKRV